MDKWLEYWKNEFGMFKKYGWKRDALDARDFVLSLVEAAAVPPSVDLRPQMGPIFDQGALGSCTANAVCGYAEYIWNFEKKTKFVPSRLYSYYNTRALEGTTRYDSGASIRDTVKAANSNGFCHENLWPYVINKFTVKPPSSAYADGKLHPAIKYQRVTQVQSQMKAALASGYPIILGFSVYESFESDAVAKTGIVPMPDVTTEQLLGGHAVDIVGYNDSKNWWVVRNSWGTGWGDQGYFYVPYNYFTNPLLASDLWTLTLIS